MSRRYQRARRPEQKAERRAQIIAAAKSLLGEQPDVRAWSLNELARRAGMAKSNLYRYFESREAVLLAILDDQVGGWSADLGHALSRLCPDGPFADRVDAVARSVSQATAGRPRMCHLLSVLPSVLERNVDATTVRAFKLASLHRLAGLAPAMHRVLPELSIDAHAELFHHVLAVIVGTWPLARPAPVVAEVLADPALAPFRYDFEQDLRRTIALMAWGMRAEGAGS
ncbi:MAG: TetR/AcrR family transcriptional regulator [Deltaproteobacteria bacterium]|nr:MAG: TetR/AcrR family transcriptional regulator [Deltaproteobacteria bacterium]